MSVVKAHRFLVAVPLELVVIEEDENWIIAFILPCFVCLDPKDTFVCWCSSVDLFWGDGNMPHLGAGGRATGCLDLTKLSLMSLPRNEQ